MTCSSVKEEKSCVVYLTCVYIVLKNNVIYRICKLSKIYFLVSVVSVKIRNF